MDRDPASTETLQPSDDAVRRARKVRRFSLGMTGLMILLCNALLLGGVWLSGVNLDRLIRLPDIFNPKDDICLRLGWQKVAGSQELVRLCSEWIHLSDPSGKPHQFQTGTEVKQDMQGRLYLDHGTMVDYRLFAFALFVAGVILFGIMVKRYLVTRYRLRLEMAAPRHSSMS